MSDPDAERPRLPEGLLARLRADPVRAPEHLALAAAERHAPDAREWVEHKRARFAITPAELAVAAKKRHSTLARFEGAAMGVGGIFTVVPDLAALAWIQTRLVFYVAASYGFDPFDPMRPAELLVLREFFADPLEARAALDGVEGSTSLAAKWVGGKLEREEALMTRLAKMAGKTTARRVAGRFLPLFAVVTNSVANERDTRALADRAIRFYGG